MEMKSSIIIAGVLVAVLSLVLVEAFALPAMSPNQRGTGSMMNNSMYGSCLGRAGRVMRGSMMGGSMMMNAGSWNYQQCQQYAGQSQQMM